MATVTSGMMVQDEITQVVSTPEDIQESRKHFFSVIIFVFASLFIWIGMWNWNSNDVIWDILMSFPWGRPFYILCLISLAITLAECAWRIYLVAIYKPIQSVSDDKLPFCTVIVPAYNEGELVMGTLKSLAASDYPHKKLQIIAVDDGSEDDTWYWIKKAKHQLQGRLHIIKLSKNQGKRHALYCGFRKSTGSVIVTVDSDSLVRPDTLRNLTSPFAVSRRVGGVAGNVRVLNCEKGVIPRMLDVVFTFSFDFMRSSQSVVKAVMCTPGALSAYRRDIVVRISKEWLGQTFMGQPAKIGEDRAMTNLILREGFHVVFQKNAYVFTEVPTTYKKLCNMLLRWSRSNIRETIAMSRFAFTRFRNTHLLGPRINFLLSLRVFFMVPFFTTMTWCLILWEPVHFGTNTVMGIMLFSSIPAGLYGWKYNSLLALWSYPYGLFRFLTLFWIVPYAMITPHKSDWLTRKLNTGNHFKIFALRKTHSIS